MKVLEIATKCSSSRRGKPWISYATETLLGAPGERLEMQVNDESFEATEAGSVITHCPPSSDTHKPAFLETENPTV